MGEGRIIEHIIKYDSDKPKPNKVLGEGLREVTLSPKERRRLPEEKESLKFRNKLRGAREDRQEKEEMRERMRKESKAPEERNFPDRRSGQSHHSISPQKTEPYRGGKETRPWIEKAA